MISRNLNLTFKLLIIFPYKHFCRSDLSLYTTIQVLSRLLGLLDSVLNLLSLDCDINKGVVKNILLKGLQLAVSQTKRTLIWDGKAFKTR
jgi:hypothetical protein